MSHQSVRLHVVRLIDQGGSGDLDVDRHFVRHDDFITVHIHLFHVNGDRAPSEVAIDVVGVGQHELELR